MADPNQPTSLKMAIRPVGTCTSMCPEYERVERIVQKMVDRSEKVLWICLRSPLRGILTIFVQVSGPVDKYYADYGK